MVSVEFSLHEETSVVPDEVQQEVEALVKEKSNRFAALEWVGVQKGKMEVVVRDKVVAEALVENQLGKPYTVKEVLNGGLMKEKKVIG